MEVRGRCAVDAKRVIFQGRRLLKPAVKLEGLQCYNDNAVFLLVSKVHFKASKQLEFVVCRGECLKKKCRCKI